MVVLKVQKFQRFCWFLSGGGSLSGKKMKFNQVLVLPKMYSPPGDSKRLFDPLVEGHKQPAFERVTFSLTIPNKVTNNNLAHAPIHQFWIFPDFLKL